MPGFTCPAEVSAIDWDGQHGDSSLYKPLTAHVATRTPSPPLESAATEVTAGHSHPMQTCRAIKTDASQKICKKIICIIIITNITFSSKKQQQQQQLE